MDEHPAAAVCGPKLLNPDGSVQHHIRSFASLGVFFLQNLNWHKLFPRSKLMNRYYNTDFDYSKSQPVESIGTSVYVIRRSTWETIGLLDERFRWAMPDLAYNYTLNRKGYKLFYTPCAGLIDFSDAYDYFGKSWLTKAIVRFGVRARYCTKVLGYYLSSDKRVIKGPGAPKKEIAAQAALLLEPGARGAKGNGLEEGMYASFSQPRADAKSVRSQ